MKKEVQLVLTPARAASPEACHEEAVMASGFPPEEVTRVRIVRKSVDARGRQIKINLAFEVTAGETPSSLLENEYRYSDVSGRPEVVIVGAGPAGLFAALRLIEAGFRPVILERGKPVGERKADIDKLESEHLLNPDSNYCFGEGGAGTFSDGKLYTRSKKRGDISRILEILYLHGADESVLYEAHPHIGSDRLPCVVASMRRQILDAGGIIRFNTCVTGITLSGNRITGMQTKDGETITAGAYILATGHSARDTYFMLSRSGINLETKSFAMGVRVEHPQELIDTIQYHGRKDKFLPSASYSLVEQVNGRGVYSFCMCPGGQIVPSATADYEIVVNGMSLARRDSPFANSGIVVQVMPQDFRSYQNLEGLAGLRLQELFEQKAYRQAHSGQKAPAQRLTDFISNRASQNLPVSSYLPGLIVSPMHEWMPDFVKKSLQEGFRKFDSKMKGFITRDAIIAGVESRTSSPVRIPRDPDTGSHVRIVNLFPAGEGAGYAGGIVSSAVDGENAALHCAAFLG